MSETTSARLKRLLVVGTSGSGKSTIARAAARRLGLPFVASDDFWWQSGWHPVELDVVQKRVQEIAREDAWVLESNFDSFRNLLWPRADLVVWLDFSRPVVFWRVLRRNLFWALRGAEVWSGNRMTFRRAWSGVRHAMHSFSDKRQHFPDWLSEWAQLMCDFVGLVRRVSGCRGWQSSKRDPVSTALSTSRLDQPLLALRFWAG